MDATSDDEFGYARLTRELTEKVHRTCQYMLNKGASGTPTLQLLTIQFNFGRSAPPPDQTGESVNEALLALAADTLDLGQDLVYDLVDSLAALQDAQRPGMIPPFAVAAIDYPGTEEGWPRASEPPHLNAVVVLPALLREEFGRFVRGEYAKFVYGGSSNYTPGYWTTRIHSVEARELEYSDAGVETAVSHVLKLCKTLPWKVLGDGASICYVRYSFDDHGKLVSDVQQ